MLWEGNAGNLRLMGAPQVPPCLSLQHNFRKAKPAERPWWNVGFRARALTSGCGAAVLALPLSPKARARAELRAAPGLGFPLSEAGSYCYFRGLLSVHAKQLEGRLAHSENAARVSQRYHHYPWCRGAAFALWILVPLLTLVSGRKGPRSSAVVSGLPCTLPPSPWSCATWWERTLTPVSSHIPMFTP